MNQETLNENYSALCEFWSRQQDNKAYNNPTLEVDENGNVFIVSWNNTTTEPTNENLQAINLTAALALQARKREIAKAAVAILPKVAVGQIEQPQTAMLVWDPNDSQCKLYDGTQWITLMKS
jgi:hypothetical protein